MTKTAELYLCLYAREFPAQALLRLRPELRDLPCAVVQGEPPMQQVCSFNTKAARLGVEHGMTRVEMDTIPSVVVLPRSGKEEAAAKAVLLECAGTFSPRVEDRSDGNVFICVLDIAGTEKLWGRPEVLARSLRKRIRVLGVSTRVSISSNFHTAVCLARDLTGPSMIHVAAGEESKALASLSLEVLDLTEQHAETFSLWGIYTLGALAALPEQGLIARLGQEGKRLRFMSLGKLPHLFLPVEPAFTLEERIELDSPVELLDSLLFIVNIMLEQLIHRAMSRALSLASVTINLHLESEASYTRTVRPALPMDDRQVWVKLLHLDLEANPPMAAILALKLHAEAGSISKVQLGLFSPQLPEPTRLDVTLARIRSIVGDDCVGCAVLTDTNAMDAFLVDRFVIFTAHPAEMKQLQRTVVRKIRPPEMIAVTLDQQVPVFLYFRTKRYAIERAYGPWRNSGNWWSEALWNCEQWDMVAHTQNGELLCCCVIRDLNQNCWQIVTLYD